MSDVLDDRDYTGSGWRWKPNHISANTTLDKLSRGLAEHVVDLKAEVMRLRALPKAELTEVEQQQREAVRFWLHAQDEFGRRRYPYTRNLLAAMDRICPPKAPPTDEELAKKLDGICDLTRIGYTEVAVIQAVASVLRARKEQK